MNLYLQQLFSCRSFFRIFCKCHFHKMMETIGPVKRSGKLQNQLPGEIHDHYLLKQKSTYHFILSFNLGGWKLLFVIRKSALKKTNSISVAYIAKHTQDELLNTLFSWQEEVHQFKRCYLNNITHLCTKKSCYNFYHVHSELTTQYLCSIPKDHKHTQPPLQIDYFQSCIYTRSFNSLLTSLDVGQTLEVEVQQVLQQLFQLPTDHRVGYSHLFFLLQQPLVPS